MRVSTIDYHTAGEPFRLVAEPPMIIAGETVAQRRVTAMNDPEIDDLRRWLCFEPRGHADMYGGFVVPADDGGAHFGVLFWHKDGFSTACGHGTIALGAWAVQNGVVETDPSGVTEVHIDVPSGRVTARVHTTADRVERVDFVNVASYVLARGVEVRTTRGPVSVDVSFGGAIYAQLPASDLGLTVSPDDLGDLIAVGRDIKGSLEGSDVARHPNDDRLSGIYGTILYDDLGVDEHGTLHQRNVTIFADGEVDRSPCGSGTGARVAVLAADGRLDDGGHLVHESVIGTRFDARVVEEVEIEGRRAWIPEVSGMAFRTGEHVFVRDPDDPLHPGFVLR